MSALGIAHGWLILHGHGLLILHGLLTGSADTSFGSHLATSVSRFQLAVVSAQPSRLHIALVLQVGHLR